MRTLTKALQKAASECCIGVSLIKRQQSIVRMLHDGTLQKGQWMIEFFLNLDVSTSDMLSRSVARPKQFIVNGLRRYRCQDRYIILGFWMRSPSKLQCSARSDTMKTRMIKARASTSDSCWEAGRLRICCKRPAKIYTGQQGKNLKKVYLPLHDLNKFTSLTKSWVRCWTTTHIHPTVSCRI